MNAREGGGEGGVNSGGGNDKDGKESDGRIHCLSCHRTKVAERGFVKGPCFVRTKGKRFRLVGG